MSVALAPIPFMTALTNLIFFIAVKRWRKNFIKKKQNIFSLVIMHILQGISIEPIEKKDRDLNNIYWISYCRHRFEGPV